jgi:putative membrane protein
MWVAPDEAERIEAALRAARSRSSGEIVCVLARASARYETMPVVWSALIAMALPWPLLIFTHQSAERIFLAQLAVFLVALGVLSLPRLRLSLTPRSVRRSNAHRVALEQFVSRGLTRSKERNSILIYVSLAERYARIIADVGAAKAIGQDQWKAIVDRLADELKAGSASEALIGAAARCGDLLAKNFPPRPGAPAPTVQRFHAL